MVVNCTQYEDGTCRAGHYGGHPPIVACRLCQHRIAIDQQKQAVPVNLTIRRAATAKPCGTCGSRSDARAKQK